MLNQKIRDYRISETEKNILLGLNDDIEFAIRRAVSDNAVLKGLVNRVKSSGSSARLTCIGNKFDYDVGVYGKKGAVADQGR